MKTVEEIYGEMKAAISQSAGVTLRDDGDMGLRLYAVAAELYSLWVQADFVERQCFPQTATGSYLDAHAQLRGLSRQGAVCAEGAITFTLGEVWTQDRTIEAGAACTTAAGTAFVTTEAGVIPAGETACTVPAQAVEPGAAGNVPAGSVTVMVLPPVGVASCSNAAAFAGGADAEGDEALRARVLASYKQLPNGANAAYYAALARSVDGVGAVEVLPKKRGVGTVDLVIAGAEGVPAQSLVAAVQALVERSREICVDVLVSAPETETVNVQLKLDVEANADFTAVSQAVEAALEGHFTGALLGRGVLLAEMGNLVYQVPGVKNYAFIQPAADLAPEAGTLPVLGQVAISGWEEA